MFATNTCIHVALLEYFHFLVTDSGLNTDVLWSLEQKVESNLTKWNIINVKILKANEKQILYFLCLILG